MKEVARLRPRLALVGRNVKWGFGGASPPAPALKGGPHGYNPQANGGKSPAAGGQCHLQDRLTFHISCRIPGGVPSVPVLC